MSTTLGAIGHTNAIASGYAAQQATNTYSTGQLQMANTGITSITQGVGMGGSIFGQPLFNEGQHIFNCQKVENGWTLNYRNKQYIASDLDSLMDQMKAAMVLERIEK